MTDTLSIGHAEDTGKGKHLKTGSMRRSYNKKCKKKKMKSKFKVRTNKYTEGR